ncbi:hypothetical protein Aci022_122 [Acinetobacter phage vB_AbaM_B09_Aci02-2]|uniref:Uncharacterized protein n=1 Tax=Acinetobacter phage vB_AbaM_B09_Aci02-2 TaxID=2315467 RepID=A0A386KN02_9CAUD|nr:hypothetical protein HOU30_gp068 [Acinetobacter phage vB_AbaM_B09_Aci02-2]AYD85811.1 hypothetical protein Aci022_122 [Acinetobacter phage vB_AbaM_B09_Aci02-2]
MAMCLGGPLHGKHANCGRNIYTSEGNVFMLSYELRDYWYNDGSTKKIQLYQHASYSDDCVIKFLNEKFNLSPVEKKS